MIKRGFNIEMKATPNLKSLSFWLIFVTVLTFSAVFANSSIGYAQNIGEVAGIPLDLHDLSSYPDENLDNLVGTLSDDFTINGTLDKFTYLPLIMNPSLPPTSRYVVFEAFMRDT